MLETASQPSKRLLDPVERYSEIPFGLIMVLTFTGSLSASGFGHDLVALRAVREATGAGAPAIAASSPCPSSARRRRAAGDQRRIARVICSAWKRTLTQH